MNTKREWEAGERPVRLIDTQLTDQEARELVGRPEKRFAVVIGRGGGGGAIDWFDNFGDADERYVDRVTSNGGETSRRQVGRGRGAEGDENNGVGRGNV